MSKERRTENRMLCADILQIQWKDRSGTKDQATALLEDISATGACLQTEVPVPLGAEIKWDSPGQFFSGYVRYCVYREIGYFIGVQFGESTKWSQGAYTPQHLLDPQTLVEKNSPTAATTPRGQNRHSTSRSLRA